MNLFIKCISAFKIHPWAAGVYRATIRAVLRFALEQQNAHAQLSVLLKDRGRYLEALVDVLLKNL